MNRNRICRYMRYLEVYIQQGCINFQGAIGCLCIDRWDHVSDSLGKLYSIHHIVRVGMFDTVFLNYRFLESIPPHTHHSRDQNSPGNIGHRWVHPSHVCIDCIDRLER